MSPSAPSSCRVPRHDVLTWVSLHVHHHESPERVVTDAAGPLVHELAERGWIDRFFYLRHWQGGRHVRLRLRATRPELQSTVATTATRQLSRYLHEHPSRRAEDEAGHRAETAWLRAVEPGSSTPEPLRPDNTIESPTFHGIPDPMTGEPLADELADIMVHAFTVSTQRAFASSRKHIEAAAAVVAVALARPEPAAFLSAGDDEWAAALLGPLAAAAREGFAIRAPSDRAVAAEIVRRVRAADAGGRRLAAIAPPTLPDRLAQYCLHTHCNRLGLSLVDEAYVRYLVAHEQVDR